MAAFITLSSVVKYFDEGRSNPIVGNISLSIEKGDLITVFGPNGAGKTTLLHMIAGLEKPSLGTITHASPLRIGYVFQNYDESLLPWYTALENIRLPFKMLDTPKAEADAKVEQVVKLLKLEPYLAKYPYMLSGGKKQLVALARALVTEPDLLIMDEPFSSLDFDTTNEMEQLVLNIWKNLGITILFVSHDIDEAILLATKIVILSPQPSTIKKIIDVELPFPRNLGTTTTDEFAEIKRQVLRTYETA